MANSWLPSVSKRSYLNLQTNYFGTVKIFLGCMHSSYLHVSQSIFHCMKSDVAQRMEKRGFTIVGFKALTHTHPSFTYCQIFKWSISSTSCEGGAPHKRVYVFPAWWNWCLPFDVNVTQKLYFHFFFDGLLSKRQFLPVDLLLGILVFLGHFLKVRTDRTSHFEN